MKKITLFSILALAVMAIASCQKEKEVELNPGEVAITATRVANSTRSFLCEEQSDEGEVSYPIYWDAPDKILVGYAGMKPATFKSKNTEPAAEATFTGKLPEGEGLLYGIYPAESSNEIEDDYLALIIFHDEQDAVAGSFDPLAFPAVAVSETKNLSFMNVCGLVRLQVGSESITKIELTPLGNLITTRLEARPEAEVPEGLIGGTLAVSLDGGAPAIIDYETALDHITLLAPEDEGTFNPDDVYYMVVPPCHITDGVVFTLTHSDGSEEYVQLTGSVKVERNKVHDAGVLGESEEPGGPDEPEPEPELQLVKVWGHAGVAGVAGWPAYVTGAEELDTYLRSATMDDDYVYIVKTQGTSTDGSNFDEVKIFKFDVSDGSYAGLVQRTVDPDYMAGTWQGLWPVACARVMKNTDNSVNDGKDILVATNLIDGGTVRAYAWVNGVDAEPVRIASFENWRRMGDRITVSGTYQSGRIWYASAFTSASMVAWLTVTDGSTPSYGFDALGAIELGEECVNEYYPFSNGAFGLIANNAGTGLRLVNGQTVSKTYEGYKRCFGWNAFSFEGTDYLAYLDMAGGTNLPIVTVLEGSSDTFDDLQATLEAKTIAFQAGIATDDPDDLTTTCPYATNNQGDCTVRIIDGTPYILGMARGGIGLFKMVLE